MGKSWQNVLFVVAVIVVGALLGTVLGKLMGLVVPEGPWRNLLVEQISGGLHPLTLDLWIIELTLGCLFKFSFLSIEVLSEFSSLLTSSAIYLSRHSDALNSCFPFAAPQKNP